MIPAVAYTLADFLANGISLIGTEHIGFEHPSYQLGSYPAANLYLYDIHPAETLAHRKRFKMRKILGRNSMDRFSRGQNVWFDASFLLTVQDHTAMGKQHLISKALSHLLQHQQLPNNALPPGLQGYGAIPLRANPINQQGHFWEALGIPRQPALNITVTIPFNVVQEAMSLGA